MSPPPLVRGQDQLEQLVRRLVAEELAQFLEMTYITRSSEDDDERQDVVRLYEDPNGQPSTIDLARFEQWGTITVPPNNEPAIILRRGDQGVLFPVTSNRYRPTGFKRGDHVVFCSKDGTRIALHGADSATPGAIEILTAAGSSAILDKDGNVDLTSSGNAKARLGADGKISIEAAQGAKVEMATDTLVTTLLKATHFGGNPAAPPPTAAPGPALKGGPAVATGTDASFLLTMAVLPPPPAPAGLLATVTFGTNYDSPPQFSIAAASPILAAPAGLGAISAVATQSQLMISTALPLLPGPCILSVTVKQ